MNNIVIECAGILKINVEDLQSDSRKKEIAFKRKLIWYKLKAKGYTEQQIGEYFRRSKGTVFTGIKSIKGYLFWNDKETINSLMLIGMNLTLKNNKVEGVI